MIAFFERGISHNMFENNHANLSFPLDRKRGSWPPSFLNPF